MRPAALSRELALAVAAADHQTLAYRSERGLVAAVSKRLASHGQHSKILRDAQHLRAQPNYIILNNRGSERPTVEGVAAALVSGLDSCGSPSALSVSRAHSTDQAALEEPLRCSEPYASKAPAVACSDHGRSVRVNRAVGPVDAHSSEEVQDRHSRRS